MAEGVTIDGVWYPSTRAWSEASDKAGEQRDRATLTGAPITPGLDRALQQIDKPASAPQIVPIGRAPAVSPAVAAGSLEQRRVPEVPGYKNRGDWLDTVVMPRESGGNPNIGWGQTDLTPWLSAGKTVHGFPDWPGKPGPAGNSTAAGLYQITKTNWKHYAPMLGVNDFSPESQRRVAEAIKADQGERAWAASEPGAGAGRRMGGRFGGMGPRLGGVPGEAATTDPLAGLELGGDAASRSRLALALSPSPPGAVATPVAAQPTAPAPGAAAHPLQPVPLQPVPNLHTGYQDALAAILSGKRRGLGSIFG